MMRTQKTARGSVSTTLHVDPPIIATAASDGAFCIKRGDAAIPVETSAEANFLIEQLKTAKKHFEGGTR